MRTHAGAVWLEPRRYVVFDPRTAWRRLQDLDRRAHGARLVERTETATMTPLVAQLRLLEATACALATLRLATGEQRRALADSLLDHVDFAQSTRGVESVLLTLWLDAIQRGELADCRRIAGTWRQHSTQGGAGDRRGTYAVFDLARDRLGTFDGAGLDGLGDGLGGVDLDRLGGLGASATIDGLLHGLGLDGHHRDLGGTVDVGFDPASIGLGQMFPGGAGRGAGGGGTSSSSNTSSSSSTSSSSGTNGTSSSSGPSGSVSIPGTNAWVDPKGPSLGTTGPGTTAGWIAGVIGAVIGAIVGAATGGVGGAIAGAVGGFVIGSTLGDYVTNQSKSGTSTGSVATTTTTTTTTNNDEEDKDDDTTVATNDGDDDPDPDGGGPDSTTGTPNPNDDGTTGGVIRISSRELQELARLGLRPPVSDQKEDGDGDVHVGVVVWDDVRDGGHTDPSPHAEEPGGNASTGVTPRSPASDGTIFGGEDRVEVTPPEDVDLGDLRGGADPAAWGGRIVSGVAMAGPGAVGLLAATGTGVQLLGRGLARGGLGLDAPRDSE